MKKIFKPGDILGMNARNLHYISRYNSHASKRFADDKIFTKHFLESRGIGVAKLFHVIKNHTQLTESFFSSLPSSFVVKPNRGFAGGGILVITNKKGRNWISASGKKINEEELYLHCSEILDGKYAISGTTDTVIFEERLETHPKLLELSDTGLPDVRMIVFNNVPVMAMLRVPTEESDGKANMELGAYGIGIDIGSGKTTGAAYFSKFRKRLPNGASTIGFQVPFWDEILYATSKIQTVSDIGYLGVDMVITKSGIKVLELNARAGLKIQIANRIPLKPRLKKVGDLKILTPEEGVEIAKKLFSQKSVFEEKIEQKPVIGAYQTIVLNAETPIHLIAKIDLTATTNKISSEFFDEDNPLLDITIAGKRLKLPVEKSENMDGDLILAGKFLGDFYIDPNKEVSKTPEMLTAHVDEQKIHNVDRKISEIDEQLKLLSYINPKNIQEQKELFLSHPNYSPRFFYKELNIDVPLFRRELKKIPVVDHPLYQLFVDKTQELEHKISLLESVGSDEFEYFSQKVFGKVSPKDYQKSLEFLRHQGPMQADESPIVDSKFALETVESFLKQHKLSHWNVKMIDSSVADMQVSKKGSILIKKSANFSENRLKALLAHEIGTHVFRNENGKLQEFKIFQRGTADYLRTEEGIAVYNQNQLNLNLGEKFLAPALLIVTIFMAQKLGFRDLFNFLKETYNISDELAWSRCIKAKRGFLDGQKKGAFTKDVVYFKGLTDIENFVAKGGSMADLYMGKISIKDLKILEKYDKIVPAKFLLDFTKDL